MTYSKVIPPNLREKTILDRLARGWNRQQIAKEQEISEATLAQVLRTIKSKFNTYTTTQAVALAVHSNWIYPFDIRIRYPGERLSESEEETEP